MTRDSDERRWKWPAGFAVGEPVIFRGKNARIADALPENMLPEDIPNGYIPIVLEDKEQFDPDGPIIVPVDDLDQRQT